MLINKNSIWDKIISLLFFLIFGGYYCIQLLSTQNNLFLSPLIFNQLTRLLIITLLIFIWVVTPQINKNINFQYFLFFAIAYLTRILYELCFNNNIYHISTLTFLLYFLSFVFIPFLFLINIDFDDRRAILIEKSLKLSFVIFAILVIIYFRHFFSQNIGRISRIIKKGDENYISPLSISSMGSYGILLFILEIIKSRNKKIVWLLYRISLILICLVPFFLGSSRGAFISLFITSIVILFTNEAGNKSKNIVLFSILIFIGFYITFFVGSNILDRMGSIIDDIDSGNNSAIRLKIWEVSFHQFLSYPIFGNSLESDYRHFRPHNIFLEVLVSTGIIGFIPFVLLIFNTVRKSFFLLKIESSASFMSVIFIYTLITNNFSGSIYGASILFVSMAFVLNTKINQS
jgi:hypothetical protein